MAAVDPLQTVALPQSSRSRHLLERLQGINFWCGSVRGSAAGLEEESGELRYGLLRPAAGSEKARPWRALSSFSLSLATAPAESGEGNTKQGETGWFGHTGRVGTNGHRPGIASLTAEYVSNEDV